MPPKEKKAQPASCDGAPLSKLALKIPEPKKTGNDAYDQKKNFEWKAMVRLVDKMVKYPKVIQPLHNYMLSNNLETLEEEEAVAPSDWTGSYRTLERIPRSWITEYLLWRARKLQCDQTLSLEKLKAIQMHNPDMINLLFSYDTQTVPGMAFPKACSDKKVATMTFDARAGEVGNRLKGLVTRGALGRTGHVDFLLGCFGLTFDDQQRCTGVEHLPTGEKLLSLPSHITITKSYRLVDNHCDHLARVELLPAKYNLADLFPPEAAFKRTMVTKKFKRLTEIADARALEHEQQLEQEANATVQESDQVLLDAQKARMAEHLAHARTALSQRMEERNKKRRLALDAEPLPAAPLQDAGAVHE